MLHRCTITLLTSLILLVLCFHALAETAGLPSVRFAATEYEITEHYTDAWFQLVITDPPEVAIPILFHVSGGTATEWEDFNVDDNTAWFYPGGTDTISWYVQIWEDEIVEDPETIELTLNEGGNNYVVGYPNTATITIIDDDTASPPAMRLGSTQFSITEDLTGVSIPVIRSGDLLQDDTWVYISITEGTAVAGTDYEMVTNTYAEFRFFESDTSYAEFLIYEDEDAEAPETIFLEIVDGGEAYSVGYPDAATLTIIDDDSETPMAHFEIEEDIPLAPDGSIAVVTAPEVEVVVDVVVADLPPGGATIHYTSTIDGQVHSLTFTDNPRQTLVVPPSEIPAGLDYSITTWQILNPVGKDRTDGDRLNRAASSLDGLELCIACYLDYVGLIVGWKECHPDNITPPCDFNCPDLNTKSQVGQWRASPDLQNRSEDIATLSRYRDEILQGAQGGDYYIQLYQDYSPAIAMAVLQRPTLIYRVLNTWDLWLPAVAAQVNGQGSGFTITEAMQSALLGIMAEFEEVGSPELAQLMAEFRAELDLENIAGTTAADMQANIETNPMETEKSTWGSVKSMFR